MAVQCNESRIEIMSRTSSSYAEQQVIELGICLGPTMYGLDLKIVDQDFIKLQGCQI